MSMSLSLRNAMFISASVLTAACSSTPATTPVSTTTPGPAPSLTTYRGLADRASTGASTSALAGVELSSNALHPVSGALTHASGRTTLYDNVYSVTDPNGPDANGQLTNTAASFVFNLYKTDPGAGPTINDRFPYASYQYVSVYDGGYNTTSTTSVNALGVYGIATKAIDIPTAGTAYYQGQASGSYSGTAYSADLQNGSSSVTANFASGKTSVTMKNFTAINVITGNLVPSTVFDEVRLVNMAGISSIFNGGTIEFYKNGAPVSASTIIGTIASSGQGGSFYGYDSTIGAPDEVGGIAYQSGNVATLKLVFLAD